MYVYCITPSGNFKSNFIKIGFCKDLKSLDKRYGTCYGTYIYSYVDAESKKQEYFIHNKFKKLKLHIKKELFMYDNENDKCNYDFYKQKLIEFSEEYKKINDEYKIIKYISELTISKKEIISEINEKNLDNHNIKNIKYKKLESIKHIFKESLNKYDESYTKILLYSILHDIRNNGKKYDEIYKMHKIEDKSKFNQKTERCNLFIKVIEEKEIKIYKTKLSPDSFRKLNRDHFDSFLEDIKNKY